VPGPLPQVRGVPDLDPPVDAHVVNVTRAVGVGGNASGMQFALCSYRSVTLPRPYVHRFGHLWHINDVAQVLRNLDLASRADRRPLELPFEVRKGHPTVLAERAPDFPRL